MINHKFFDYDLTTYSTVRNKRKFDELLLSKVDQRSGMFIPNSRLIKKTKSKFQGLLFELPDLRVHLGSNF